MDRIGYVVGRRFQAKAFTRIHGFAAAAIALAAWHMVRASSIELVSRTENSVAVGSASGPSVGPSFAADGRFIVFSSAAADLASLPAKGNFNLFAVSATNGAVQAISLGTNGDLGNGASVAGAMSQDGRFVAFQSTSGNLAPGDTNGISDIYLRDVVRGTNALVSHRPDGIAGNDVSEFPEISADGSVVAFISSATNLVANDANGLRDLFVWNRASNSIELASVGFTGASMAADVTDFTLSADGRFVLFTATGTNLVETKRTGPSDVYLRDLQTGTTRWISGLLTNLPGLTNASTNFVGSSALSSDGRFAFMLGTGGNATRGTFVRVDLNDNTVTVIATNVPAQPVYSDGFGPTITQDGNVVAYADGTNVWYWSASTGTTQQVDVAIALPAPGQSDTPVLSADGTKVAFLSTKTNLIDGVGNGEWQIYVRDMVTGEIRLVTHSATGAATFGNGIASMAFSPDGSELVFDSRSDQLVAVDGNNEYDVFTWSVASGAINLVSSSRAVAPSLTAQGASAAGKYSVSADGRYVAFRTLAALTSKDTNGTYDVYVYDRISNTNILASAGPDGYSMGLGASSLPMISADGAKVAFESSTTGLAGPGDTRIGTSVYVRDLQTGALTNVSGAATGNLTLQQVSANGRFVFFSTTRDLHRFDLVDNVDVVEPVGITAPFAVNASADGSRVVYVQGSSMYLTDYTEASRVILGSAGSGKALLTTDGTTVLLFAGTSLLITNVVTHETNSFGPLFPTANVSMSADGNIIAYQSRAAVSQPYDIWFLDRATGETNLVSHAFGDTVSANGDSTTPSVSADGRFIAFESWATNLVGDDANNFKDVFVYDRLNNKISAISRTTSGATGNLISINPAFAPSGSILEFMSAATDLVQGDLNDDVDVFVTDVADTVQVADSDGDGLDDAWEMAAFGKLDYSANDDPDGDGSTNLAEFTAGTAPNDASSKFAIQSFDTQTNGSNRLTFKAVSGHKYRIEFKASLQAGVNWSAFGSEITATATGDSSIDIPAASEGYYRVRLVQ